jgi:hypothetical protein
MGEIKSTLDLVMEKTKHLSLSKEEKRAQRNKEVRGHLKGLVQKFQDGTLNRNQFEKELKVLNNNYAHSSVTDILKAVIIEELDINRDNTTILVLLREIIQTDTKPIGAVVAEYQKKIEGIYKKSKGARIKLLAEKHLISGSAIVPNLENDDRLRKELNRVQLEYEELLSKEKARLKPST